MRFIYLSELGGLLWWIFIRFTKTDLDVEQSEKKWARNLVFLIALGMIIAYISINYS